MDALSQLLDLNPVRVVLDYRCHLRAPWRLDEAALAPASAAFHAVLEGEAWLDLAGQPAMPLYAGDIVVVVEAAAHALRSAPAGRQPAARPLARLGTLVRMGSAVSAADGVGKSGAGNSGAGGKAAKAGKASKVNEANKVAKATPPAAAPRCELLCGRFEAVTGQGTAGPLLFAALPRVLCLRAGSGAVPDAAQRLLALLRAETDGGEAGAIAIAARLAEALFALVLRGAMAGGELPPGMLRLLADPKLAPLASQLLADPGRGWTLAAMAAACHTSRATFARRFAHSTATTPAKLLTHLRMAQAAQWLTQDRRSIAAIAAAVGYQSEAAFARSFKRCIGVGPGGYRRLGLRRAE